VIGKETREDHSQVMNTMIRFFSGAKDAEKKQAMAFDLSNYDRKLLKFGKLFEKRFMKIDISMELNDALDLAWETMAECFESQELLMKKQLVDKYFPANKQDDHKEKEALPKDKNRDE
jgi:V/A-type H+-transporting ATPase subunit B